MNIKMRNLSFKYNYRSNTDIIDDFSLVIEKGTINVLLGLNGSGKTTLLKLLTGLEKPQKGTIQYGDKNLEEIGIKDRSKIFSYVPQHSNVTGDILISDYLSFGMTNRLEFYQSPKEEHFILVRQMAERLSVTHLLDKKIGEISGGERQIILITSALIQNTPIIILDEPTSSLDIKNQNVVLSLLKEIINEGKTIIFSSHNPNHALFLDANVILMHEGQLKATGPSIELIRVERLKEVYGDAICLSEDLDYKEISFKNN
ncbi:MAG TPA: ABC transporter ATP-binding protein [Acholeplasmataceae bacterium]|nr:ABC transporter ATP-binding protein [Acholeplasmataceae bacterium]HQC30691.1 ABC transporter ATP-binding protein [Acholeplasmataceae bacterium]